VTEDEFNRRDDPLMVEFLRDTGKASERKLRLFACACCRRLGHLLTDDRLRAMLEVAEGVADGLVPVRGEGFRVAQQRAFEALNGTEEAAARLAARAVIQAAFHIWLPRVALNTALTARAARFAKDRSLGRREGRLQAGILLDIIGPLPFRSVTLPAPVLAWNAGCVVKLATGIYEERKLPEGTLDNGRLAVLADALEEAGLDDQEVLGHLREQRAAHYRGCWCLDLLLGNG
jgi:hypothetical protein